MYVGIIVLTTFYIVPIMYIFKYVYIFKYISAYENVASKESLPLKAMKALAIENNTILIYCLISSPWKFS